MGRENLTIAIIWRTTLWNSIRFRRKKA